MKARLRMVFEIEDYQGETFSQLVRSLELGTGVKLISANLDGSIHHTFVDTSKQEDTNERRE